jgi:hypothetical protein
MHPVVYVGYLLPYKSSAALQAAPDFKEDPSEYVEYAEFQEPEAILEKRATRQGARYLVHWKNAREHDNSWANADEIMLASRLLLSHSRLFNDDIALFYIHCSLIFTLRYHCCS